MGENLLTNEVMVQRCSIMTSTDMHSETSNHTIPQKLTTVLCKENLIW